jgi:hypothetical protein
MCSANAMNEPVPDGFCAATTPNAARPSVSNAAKIIATTRIVPSATNPQKRLTHEVKAQSWSESIKTKFGRWRMPFVVSAAGLMLTARLTSLFYRLN